MDTPRARRFNPAPGWPAAPEGWSPEPGWKPDPSWPAAPPGWQLWLDDASTTPDQPVDLAQGAAQPPRDAASASERSWYKKKRFIIPIGLAVLIGIIGSQSDGNEPASEAAAPAAAEQVEEKAAPEGPSAEELAAEEEAERVAAEQKAAEDAAEAEAAAAAAAEAAKGTVSQQNAYRSAQSYLSYSDFSRSGLLSQLEFESFPAADAEFAVARLEAEGGVDWNAQAAGSAKSYLEYSSFSRQGLVDQLKFEGFTPEQAEYGVSQTGL